MQHDPSPLLLLKCAKLDLLLVSKSQTQGDSARSARSTLLQNPNPSGCPLAPLYARPSSSRRPWWESPCPFFSGRGASRPRLSHLTSPPPFSATKVLYPKSPARLPEGVARDFPVRRRPSALARHFSNESRRASDGTPSRLERLGKCAVGERKGLPTRGLLPLLLGPRGTEGASFFVGRSQLIPPSHFYSVVLPRPSARPFRVPISFLAFSLFLQSGFLESRSLL